MNNLQKITISLIALLAIMFGDAPGPLWTNPDIVIDSAYDFGAISVATRHSNGEIFVAASVRDSSSVNYGIKVWRSLDGINWSLYQFFSTTTHNMYNPSISIFTADSEYLFVAFDLQDIATLEHNVRALRRAFASPSGVFLNISTVTGVAEYNPDICDNNLLQSNPLLFCTFLYNDSICFVRSTDKGTTWTQRVTFGFPGYYLNQDPDCAFGLYSSLDSTSVGVAWQCIDYNTDTKILFRKNTYNGLAAHWLPIQTFDTPAGNFDNFPALQMAHGYPSAVIMFVRKDTSTTPDAAHLYRYVSNDGAETWNVYQHYISSYASNVPEGLAVDNYLGYYHLAYRDQSGSMRYQNARYDSAAATTWSSSVYFSSGNAWADDDFPAVGVRDGQPYVAWADYHAPIFKLKFDAAWLQTAVKEHQSKTLANPITISPNPAKGTFYINYSVANAGRVRITLYDALGRLAVDIFDDYIDSGQHQTKVESKNLAAGVYFISVEFPTGTWTKRVLLVK